MEKDNCIFENIDKLKPSILINAENITKESLDPLLQNTDFEDLPKFMSNLAKFFESYRVI